MPNRENEFKLLALRPRLGCSKKFRNNLKENSLYPFYRNYLFKESETKQIVKIEEQLGYVNLYNEFLADEKPLNINVSAVVGKNGSGKSSLVEMLYLFGYLVALENGLLQPDNTKRASTLESNQIDDIKKNFKAELYFQQQNEVKCLVIDPDFEKPKDGITNIQFISLLGGDKLPLSEYFYTVANNYSIYGLNERIMGPWIGRLFHKNDGYQTPVVLNPFRDDGKIDPNGELHFAQTRLLTNLMLNKASHGEVIPGKKVTQLSFEINRSKLMRPEGFPIDDILDELEKENKKTVDVIFNDVYKALVQAKGIEDPVQNPDWRMLTIYYVIRKLIRIARNYPAFQEFYKEFGNDGIPGFKNINEFIKRLQADRSHITLKLRQALVFYRDDPFRMNDKDNRITFENDKIRMPVDVFVERLESVIENNAGQDIQELIPLAPFTPRLIMADDIPFNKLSSGEQQYIYSIQSIIYHILNLNSVFYSKSDPMPATYRWINIVLDEIELYFHPEFQRKFVHDLIRSLSELTVPKLAGINILFLTHSPFILSDIPATNVLQLADGEVKDVEMKTFAGNIHEMLSNNFFLTSTTGEFARYHYRKIIDLYERAKGIGPQTLNAVREDYFNNRKAFVYLVEQLGEPVLKGILENHLDFLDKKFKSDSEQVATQKKSIKVQIDILNQQLRDLNDQNPIS